MQEKLEKFIFGRFGRSKNHLDFSNKKPPLNLTVCNTRLGKCTSVGKAKSIVFTSAILLMWNGETITGAAALISLNKGRFFP